MSRAADRGFSFIEVLVALAILIVLATVILTSHTGIIRAENRIRSDEESRLVSARIAAEVWLATSTVERVGSDIAGWSVLFEPPAEENGTNQVTWNHWTISPSNDPGFKTALYLRPVPAKTNSSPRGPGGPFSASKRRRGLAPRPNP